MKPAQHCCEMPCEGRSYIEIEIETDDAVLRTASLKVLLFHVFMGQTEHRVFFIH